MTVQIPLAVLSLISVVKTFPVTTPCNQSTEPSLPNIALDGLPIYIFLYYRGKLHLRIIEQAMLQPHVYMNLFLFLCLRNDKFPIIF